jgi:hypothetical protein
VGQGRLYTFLASSANLSGFRRADEVFETGHDRKLRCERKNVIGLLNSTQFKSFRLDLNSAEFVQHHFWEYLLEHVST